VNWAILKALRSCTRFFSLKRIIAIVLEKFAGSVERTTVLYMYKYNQKDAACLHVQSSTMKFTRL